MLPDVPFRCLSFGIVRDIINPIIDSEFIRNDHTHYYYTTERAIGQNSKIYNIMDLIKDRWPFMSLLWHHNVRFPAKLCLVLIYSGLVKWLLSLRVPPMPKILNVNSFLVGYKRYDLQRS
jgi:hypothetical protein